MTSLLQLPEVVALVTPGQVVRIPDQTEVPLTPRIRRLIDTAAFGRLRKISQLGLVSYVYPGATHTRFEHSLGVYRNAILYLQQIARLPEVTSLIDLKQAESFLVSALLHDLGHWPYCHPIEDLRIDGWPTHEQTARVFLETPEIATCLANDWGLQPNDISELLEKRASRPGTKILGTILSGPIDIDKLDYLYRDSLHAGVPYGRQFDPQRVIASLCLNATRDGVAILEKGRTAAELMVFARYIMFCEVYWHPAVRSATAMLQRAVFGLQTGLDPGTMRDQSDEQFRDHLLAAAAATDYEGLVAGLFGNQRRLYKQVAQFSFFENAALFSKLSQRPYRDLVEVSQRLSAVLGREAGISVNPQEILVDAPPQGLEVQFRVSVKMERSGDFRALGEISPVVQSLATRQFDDLVKKVRLFVHPRLREACQQLPLDDLLDAVATF